MQKFTKLKITFFALILFLLMAKNADASVINKSPNYLMSTNGLVGYWTMDGSKVNWKTGAVTDSSGRGNTGTITNMATSTGVAIGKIGQALSFDGGNDYVDLSNDSAYGLSSETGEQTVSAWIKTSAGNASIVGMRGGDTNSVFDVQLGFDGIGNDNTGIVSFLVRDNAGLGLQRIQGTTAINDNTWHHVAVTRNSSKLMTIYVDGRQQSSGIDTLTQWILIADARIGDEPLNTSITNMNGLIDDVRIYNRALTSSEVERLYNTGATTKFNVSPTKYLTDGLVGYWTMDGKNINWKTGAVTDSSGRGNTGTITNMATSTGVAIGKIGQALDFDGSNDYVLIPNSSASGHILDLLGGPATFSAWARPSSINGTLISKRDGTALQYQFFIFADGTGYDLSYQWGDSGGIVDSWLTSGTQTLDKKWHHYAVTIGANEVVSAFYIDGVSIAFTQSGTTGTSPAHRDVNVTLGARLAGAPTPGFLLTGSLDDVRIYNRALTPSEVEGLYNIGATTKFNVSPTKYLTSGLVGYWTMDGSKVNWKTGAVTDSSGRGNTGTITNMATSTGVAIGKIGQALNFDGSNDYVSTNLDVQPSAMTETSWSAWVYPTSNSGSRDIFTDDDGGFDRGVQSSRSDGNFNIYTGSSAWAPVSATLNQWQHIVVVYASNDIYFYKNGIKYAFGSAATGGSTVNKLNIGRNPGFGQYFSGLIDDVRIYNRALSPDEIQRLYNSGR